MKRIVINLAKTKIQANWHLLRWKQFQIPQLHSLISRPINSPPTMPTMKFRLNWIDNLHQVELVPEQLIKTLKVRALLLLSKRSKMVNHHTSKAPKFMNRTVKISFISNSRCNLWKTGLFTRTKKMQEEVELLLKVQTDHKYHPIIILMGWFLGRNRPWWQVEHNSLKYQMFKIQENK